MQAVLMNFGDNTRVVCDTANKPLAIEIGQVIEADIHDAHFHMIKRAIGSDTLMVVPKESRISPKLQAIMDILKSIEADPYDVLLQKFNEVAAETRNEEVPVQPARHTMRRLLRDLAKYEVAKALHIPAKVVIREEGDVLTRKQQEELEDAQIEERNRQNAPEKPAKEARAPRKKSKPIRQPVVKTKVKRERL